MDDTYFFYGLAIATVRLITVFAFIFFKILPQNFLDVPEKNFWVTSIMGAINKNIELDSPPPGSPGMFHCAKDGLMTGLFEQAGLKNVYQKAIPGKLNCKTIDEFWQMHNDVAAPVYGSPRQS